jgi:predicted RNA methylase
MTMLTKRTNESSNILFEKAANYDFCIAVNDKTKPQNKCGFYDALGLFSGVLDAAGGYVAKICDLESFKQQIDSYGFDKFWQLFIKTYTNKTRPDLELSPSEIDIDINNPIFDIENIGKLYEIALEHANKISKKELGQYYTPKDVCNFMADKFIALYESKDNIADVCCGTGNLIISALEKLPAKQTIELINQKKLFLYDSDYAAMQLAIMKICILFIPKNNRKLFKGILNHINCIDGNFLSKSINLPENTSVISNPPYGKLPQKIALRLSCKTFKTKDMYAVFMEKIAAQSKNAVIISPQSFLGGCKFISLREALSKFGGQVYVFDNVPASVFNGKKYGVFNTNTSNSVRAAITVINKKQNGFRITPMLRFKNTERKFLFDNADKFLGNNVYADNNPWLKIPKCLEKLVLDLKQSKQKASDLIADAPNAYKIVVPSTPRYFITGSSKNLNRSSAIELYAKDKKSFDKLYVVINSTFSYLWWRIFDGGITIKKETLLSLPIPDIENVLPFVNEGIKLEGSCVINKMNAGKNNENIKLPEKFRKELNSAVLSSLNIKDEAEHLFSIHSNNLKDIFKFWT